MGGGVPGALPCGDTAYVCLRLRVYAFSLKKKADCLLHFSHFERACGVRMGVVLEFTVCGGPARGSPPRVHTPPARLGFDHVLREFHRALAELGVASVGAVVLEWPGTPGVSDPDDLRQLRCVGRRRLVVFEAVCQRAPVCCPHGVRACVRRLIPAFVCTYLRMAAVAAAAAAPGPCRGQPWRRCLRVAGAAPSASPTSPRGTWSSCWRHAW